jgi:hypothetical protein
LGVAVFKVNTLNKLKISPPPRGEKNIFGGKYEKQREKRGKILMKKKKEHEGKLEDLKN